MAVDLGTLRTLLKTKLETLGSTKVAHKYTPVSLNDANCHQWLIVPGEAETELLGRLEWTKRMWRLILVISKVASMPYGDMEAELDSYFETVENAFALAPRLGHDDDALVSVVLIGDTGPGLLDFPPGGTELWFVCEWWCRTEIKRGIDS